MNKRLSYFIKVNCFDTFSLLLFELAFSAFSASVLTILGHTNLEFIVNVARNNVVCLTSKEIELCIQILSVI